MCRAFPIVTSALLLLHSSGTDTAAGEQAASPGVGERVVVRGRESALRVEGREVARSRWENHIYRVESVASSSLTRKAEDDCIAGTVEVSKVVAVSRGIDHFTEQREQLTDVPFANSMRAVLWIDQVELDIGLGDADEAVRIAADDYLAHSVRGQIWLRRRDSDKALELAPASDKAMYEQYISNYRGAAEAEKKP
jgi:hypothetical protein